MGGLLVAERIGTAVPRRRTRISRWDLSELRSITRSEAIKTATRAARKERRELVVESAA
jgi:hypothetical protein